MGDTARTPKLLGMAMLLGLAVPACNDIFLAINPGDSSGQLCNGEFVTDEPFSLCRRASDGALGAFEVFMSDLVVTSDGHLVLADRFEVGFAEISQSFQDGESRDQVYWQLKTMGGHLLGLYEIADSAGVSEAIAGGDDELIAAVAFIDSFRRHYFFNFNLQLAAENNAVYGTDHFISCIDTAPEARDSVCYALYDLAPSGAPDGTLDGDDFKQLEWVRAGEDAAAEVATFNFSIDQYYACRDADFNTDDAAPISPECAAFDTNGSETVDALDLNNLLRGDMPDNFAPVAFAGVDQDVTVGEIVSLNGRSSFDVETTDLDYLWEQVAGPPIDLTSAFASSANFVVPNLATSTVLKFRLTVVDESGSTDTDSIEITIANGTVEEPPAEDQPPEDSAPAVSADAGPDAQVTSGTVVTLTAASSTGDGLQYLWNQASGTIVTLSATDTVQPVFIAPIVESPTVLRFDLLVTDSANETDTDSVDITVLPAS